jgi:antirestriction protein ArdC
MSEVQKSIYGRDKLNEIVQVFINQLENGTAPWIKPYSGSSTFTIPQNHYTKRQYRGINVLVLWQAINRHGYESSEFISYKQAVQLGGHVRRGERGIQVIYFELREKDKEPDTESGEIKHYFWTKVYTVFNVAQIDGLKLPPQDDPLPPDYKFKHAEEFIRRTGAKFITRKGSVPCFNSKTKIITMPPLKEFTDQDQFISTKLHELAHYAQDELDMVKQCRYGDSVYSWLEICAEITSSFLGAHFGIPLTRVQHSEYISHWVKALNTYPSILWSASTKAQLCCDHLLRKGGEAVPFDHPVAVNQ